MALFGIPLGRGGAVKIAPTADNPVVIKGLTEFLRDRAKDDDRFNTEMRKAAQSVAQMLVDAATAEARTVERSRQAVEVMKGLRATRDRIPTIKLADKSGFVSKTRPNSKRKTKVTRGDVFFGAEFGGGKFGAKNRTSRYQETRVRRAGGMTLVRSGRAGGGTTTQFLPHRGRDGYFFWPTVRKKKDEIAREYLMAIDRVLRFLKG